MCSHAIYRKLKQRISQDNIDVNALLHVYNSYAQADNKAQVKPLGVDNVTRLFAERNHTALYNAIAHTKFNPNDDYFYLDDFSRVVTFTKLDEFNCPINKEEFIDWLMEDSRYCQYDFFNNI